MAGTTEIESLLIRLVGENKQYLESLDQAAKATEKFANNANTALSVGSGFAIAKIAEKGIQELADVWGDVAPQIDQVVKASERLGVGVKELSGLKHAAETAGVPFNQLQTALNEMNKRLTQAAQGFGTTGKALAQFNLDATELAGLSVSERLDAIANAMAGIEDAGQRATLATKLFGSSGTELVSILQNGSGALGEMTANAEALGVTFNAAQGAMVAKAQDAMGRIGSAINGIKTSIVKNIAPAIRVVADYIAEWITSFSEASSALGGFGGIARGVFGAVLNVMHGVRVAWEAIEALIATIVAGVIKSVANLVDKVIGLVNKIPGVNIEFSLQGFASKADAIAAAQRKQLGDVLDQETPWKRLEREYEEYNKALANGDTAATTAKLVGQAAEAAAEAVKRPEGIEKFVGNLEKQLNDFKILERGQQLGMSSEAITLMQQLGELNRELANSNQALNAEEQDRIKTLTKQLTLMHEQAAAQKELLKSQEDMASKAHSILQASLTPIENLRIQLDEINELMQAGALTAAQGKTAADRLVSEFAKKDGLMRATAGDAVKFGSGQATRDMYNQQIPKSTDRGVWSLVNQTKVSVRTQDQILQAIQSLAKDKAPPVTIAQVAIP